MSVRFQPKSRLKQLIRPSLPVRHFTSLRNDRRRSKARRVVLGLPLVVASIDRSDFIFGVATAASKIGGDVAGALVHLASPISQHPQTAF
jgi:hypothetical protein